MDEHKGVAKGVLVQTLGPWKRLVAYLSKRLDPVASGWPLCLWIVAPTALLVKDADKLTLGQNLVITTPHAIEGVFKQPPDQWLSNAQVTHFQSLLMNPGWIKFQSPMSLNPATLLPNPDMDPLIHYCKDILAQVHNIRPDLQDEPIAKADQTWYIDGSSFVQNSMQKAGAAVTTATQVIWSLALPPGTSAQRAELVALNQALIIRKNQTVNIYTDSRYAFATAHVHGAIYQERGLLTSELKTRQLRTRRRA